MFDNTSGDLSNNLGLGDGALTQLTTGANNVAVGYNTLQTTTTGSSNVAIGNLAASNGSHSNTITINATGTSLDPTHDTGCFVKPIRNASAANALYYDNTTREITWDASGGGSGSGGGGAGGDAYVTGNLRVTGSAEAKALLLPQVTSAEGDWKSVITNLDPTTNPLMTKGMLWVNKGIGDGEEAEWEDQFGLDASGNICWGRPAKFAVTAEGDKIYAIGGYTIHAPGAGGGTKTANDAMKIWNINDTSRYMYGPFPLGGMARFNEGVAAQDGRIYRVTGASPVNGGNDVLSIIGQSLVQRGGGYEHYLAPWISLSNGMVKSVGSRAAAVMGGRIYVMGGGESQGGNSLTMCDWAEAYTPASGWASIAPLLTARNRLGAAAVGKYVYAVGGYDAVGVGGHARAAVEKYDAEWNTWSSSTSMPYPRWDLGVASLGGKIYAVGGQRDDLNVGGAAQFLASGEVYDHLTNSWSTIAPMATNRARFGFVAAGGKLFAAGGWTVRDWPPNAENGWTATPIWFITNSVERYDPITDSWTEIASLPRGRVSFAMVALAGKLYAIGGTVAPSPFVTATCCGPEAVSTTAEVYNISRPNDGWTTLDWGSANPPALRTLPVAAALGGTIFLCGNSNTWGVGTNPPGAAAGNSVETYTPTTAVTAWSGYTTGLYRKVEGEVLFPVPLTQGWGAVLMGKLYTGGGRPSSGTNFPTAWNVTRVYDPMTDVWTHAAPPMVAQLPDNDFQRGAQAASLGGKLYLMGGYDNNALAAQFCRRYDPNTDSWSMSAQLNHARMNFGAAALCGRIYAMGGFSEYVTSNPQNMEYWGVPTYSAEAYDPSANTWTTLYQETLLGLTGGPANAALPWCYIGVAALMGRLYAVGGITNNASNPSLPQTFSSTCVAYNPYTAWGGTSNDPSGTWTQIASADERNLGSGGQVTAMGGKLYVVSGAFATGVARPDWASWMYCPLTPSVNVYDPPIAWGGTSNNATGEWNLLNVELPAIRMSGCVVTLLGHIYTVGGGARNDAMTAIPYDNRDDTGANFYASWGGFKSLALEDPQWHSIQGVELIDERFLYAAARRGVVLGSRFYILGGMGQDQYNPTGYPAMRDVQSYDPSSNTWARAAPMDISRCFFGAASLGGKIYAVGGVNHIDNANPLWSPLDSAASYNPPIAWGGGSTDPSGTWSPIASLNTARFGFGLSAFAGKLYATGGIDDSTNWSSNPGAGTVEVLDVAAGAPVWEFITPLPEALVAGQWMNQFTRQTTLGGALYVIADVSGDQTEASPGAVNSTGRGLKYKMQRTLREWVDGGPLETWVGMPGSAWDTGGWRGHAACWGAELNGKAYCGWGWKYIFCNNCVEIVPNYQIDYVTISGGIVEHGLTSGIGTGNVGNQNSGIGSYYSGDVIPPRFGPPHSNTQQNDPESYYPWWSGVHCAAVGLGDSIYILGGGFSTPDITDVGANAPSTQLSIPTVDNVDKWTPGPGKIEHDPDIGNTTGNGSWNGWPDDGTTPQIGSWAHMISPKAMLAVVALGGKIYEFGGIDNHPDLHGNGAGNTGTGAPWGTYYIHNSMNSWDPRGVSGNAGWVGDISATKLWTSLTPMPTARYNLMGAALQGKIYALGGATTFTDLSGGTPSQIPPGTTVVEVYEPNTGTWSTIASLMYPHISGNAVTIGSKLYALGGYWPSTEFGANFAICPGEVYDVEVPEWGWQPITHVDAFWMDTAANDLPSTYAADVALMGKIIHMGGGGGWEGTSLNAFSYTDANKDEAATIQTKFYIGDFVDHAADSPSGWSQAAPMDISRQRLGAAALGGKIYACGGCLATNSQWGYGHATATCEVYDPTTNVWSPIAPMDISRIALGVAALGGKLYAVGGRNNVGLDWPAAGGGSAHVHKSGEVYDPITNIWSPIADMHFSRYAHSMSALGRYIYVVGGCHAVVRDQMSVSNAYLAQPWDQANIRNGRADVQTATGGTTTGPNLPVGHPLRSVYNANLTELMWFAAGGATGSGICERYDPLEDIWEIMEDPPFTANQVGMALNIQADIYSGPWWWQQGLCYATMTAIGGRLVRYGGISAKGDKAWPNNNLGQGGEGYGLPLDPGIYTPRAFTYCTTLNNNNAYGGGTSNLPVQPGQAEHNMASANCWTYATRGVYPSLGYWRRPGEGRPAWHYMRLAQEPKAFDTVGTIGCMSAAIGGRIYVMGGNRGVGYNSHGVADNGIAPYYGSTEPNHAVYSYDTNQSGAAYTFYDWDNTGQTDSSSNGSGEWTIEPSMPTACCGGVAVALGGKIYVVGGGDSICSLQEWTSPNADPFPVDASSISNIHNTNRVQVFTPPTTSMPQITHQGEDFYLNISRGGPKTFVIPHPEHEGKMLRHACLEAPTRGTNVYEYQMTTTEGNQVTEIPLPSYFKHINGSPKIFVSPTNVLSTCYGNVNEDLTAALITTEKPGTFNVMVTGVRKDPGAVAYSATEHIDEPIAAEDIPPSNT